MDTAYLYRMRSFKSITSTSDWQILQIGGHIFFAILFAMSLYFWKERQAYDTSHYLLEIITRQNIFIAHQRPIGFVSQILPLIGVWLKLPMAVLMKLYSVGDVLYYYLLFLLTSRVLKNNPATLLIMLLVCITVAFSFYCPVTELLQGLALLAVWWALLYHPFRLRTTILIAIQAIIIFSHPLLFITVGFTIIWWWSLKKEKRQLATVIGISFLVITSLKLLLLDKYDYQKTYYPVVFNDYSNVNNLYDFNYILSFFNLLFNSYPLLFILATITLILLIIKKEIFKPIMYVLAIIAFGFIIIGTHRFVIISNYSERMLLPFALIICLPFCQQVFPIRNEVVKYFVLIVTSIFILFRVNIIRETALPYTLRLAQMTELIKQARNQNQQKVIAEENYLEQVPFANTGWCYSIESMILSAVDGKDSVVSIGMMDDHIKKVTARGDTINEEQWIKWAEEIRPVSELPLRYFRFKRSAYMPLRTTCTKRDLNENAYVVKLDTNLIQLDRHNAVAKVSITGNNFRTCVADSLLHFQYAIYDLTNNVQVNSKTVYFETDFSGSYSQFLLLENVIASNQYQVDLKLKYGESILKELKVVLQ
jgi:hypothetical protein